MLRTDVSAEPLAGYRQAAQSRRLADQAWPADMLPVVSIVCLAYNHDRFIGECLDGLLMQETTFPVEILIHDDASTDRTAEVIHRYEVLYPQIIKPIYQTENQYSKVKHPDVVFMFPRAKGKYIALCEGDDYWTASDKLQIQVEFMESHPEFSGCFHNVDVVYADGSKSPHPLHGELGKDTFTVEDLAVQNVIPTPSAFFRARLFPEFPEWYARVPIGDWPLHVLNAQHGSMRYMDRRLAVYRVHSGGVWSALGDSARARKSIEVAKAIDAHLDLKYTRAIRKSISRWRRNIALEASLAAADKGFFGHLRWCVKICFSREQISKTATLAFFVKRWCPLLYSRLKQVRRAVSCLRN